MKHLVWLVTLVAALAVGLAACSKKNEVDTAKLQKSFQTADSATQSTVNKAIVAIQSADYTEALNELKKVAGQAKLTPEQQQTVKDTIDQVTKMMGQKVEKAVGDLQKSIPAPK